MAHPLCAFCQQMGKVQEANIVDHRIPHKGDTALFYSAGNLQSLCKHCHDSHKQRQEVTGVLIGGDEHGVPVDPSHHWNKTGGG